MDCGLPGSSVHEILQASILEWVTCPPPGNLLDPGIELMSHISPALAGGFLPLAPPGKPLIFYQSHLKHVKRKSGKEAEYCILFKWCIQNHITTTCDQSQKLQMSCFIFCLHSKSLNPGVYFSLIAHLPSDRPGVNQNLLGLHLCSPSPEPIPWPLCP